MRPLFLAAALHGIKKETLGMYNPNRKNSAMTSEQIQLELKKRADEKYRKFSAALLPGVKSILGVRLPELRAMARRMAGGDWRKNLEQISDATFEEIMLQGMIIGYADCILEEKLERVKSFVPKIGNWSVCDSFCSTLKFAKDEQERVFSFLQPYLASEKEFEQRFAAVMLLDYYIDGRYLFKTVNALEKIKADGYYAKMAVAWAMAECYLHFPDKVLPILKQKRLPPEIWQKTLQKITESRTISKEAREEIKNMKKQRCQQD